ncbi:MAG TPA: class E sortase [Cellulomonas sp.]
MTTLTHARSPRASRAARAGYGALGIVGELLITAGVLLLGFLAWQLWWTDVVADKAQAQIVDSLPWAHAAQPAAGQSPTPGASAAPLLAVPRHDDPPVDAEPGHAVTFATIQVPRWDGIPAKPISEGTDKAGVLDRLGVGHYDGTAMPGAVGNFAVAGHRTTYGKPFNRIAEIQVGDPVVVRTEHTWYVYRVTSIEIVVPTAVQVVAPVPDHPGAKPTARMITMTTCNPMYSAKQRYVVHGQLDYWASADDGSVPAELVGAAS